MDANTSAFGSTFLATTGTTTGATGLMIGAIGTTGSAKNGCSTPKTAHESEKIEPVQTMDSLSERGAGGVG
jgi:hypothetical protein